MKKKYKTNQKKRRTTAPNNLTNRRSARATEDRRTDVTPPRYFYCQRNLYTSTFIPFLVSSFSFFFFFLFLFLFFDSLARLNHAASCAHTRVHSHSCTHIYNARTYTHTLLSYFHSRYIFFPPPYSILFSLPFLPR